MVSWIATDGLRGARFLFLLHTVWHTDVINRRRTNVYVPPVPAKEHAEDACSIDLRGDMHILVAHSHLSGGKELTLVSRSGHVRSSCRRLRQALNVYDILGTSIQAKA